MSVQQICIELKFVPIVSRLSQTMAEVNPNPLVFKGPTASQQRKAAEPIKPRLEPLVRATSHKKPIAVVARDHYDMDIWVILLREM